MKRLDAVEIKVTIGQGKAAATMHALGLAEHEALRRTIYFCETRDAGKLLLDRGIILRLRDTTGKGGDSTVKFRPLEDGRLCAGWSHVFGVLGGEMRIEGDWVGTRRDTVAAAMVVEQADGEVAEAAAGARPLSRLFSPAHEDFLGDYARPAVELDRLRTLGPIKALKWEPKARGFPHDLAAERWTVDDLDFLELSLRVEHPAEALAAQEGLERILGDRGLLGGAVQEAKTRTVIEHFLRRG